MRFLWTSLVLVLVSLSPAVSQVGEWVEKLGLDRVVSHDRGEIAEGLKEALYIGSENAVLQNGRLDGYFRNEVIKILLPENFQVVERGLRLVGQGELIDEFVLSMNRAAERAAPHAKEIFWDAIRGIDFDDAREILTGGETAATEYFRVETSDRLAEAFLPVVQRATDEVGATRRYKELIGQYQAISFAQSLVFDVDDYVVKRGLDGLFYVLGEEERKIRTDPAARVTELLQRVFSSRR